MPPPLRYRAFLSYAHKDVGWARWLHERLESFRIEPDLLARKPAEGAPFQPVPRSLRPIFRDRNDFPGGHALKDSTIAAIDQSAALIVLCSPVAATRPAVNEEIRLFRWRHPERPVIPVVVAGSFPDCFPPALRHEIEPDGSVSARPVTILGPDLRDAGDGRSLGIAKIVAGLTGLLTDDIFRRAERARARALRRWVAGLSLVAVSLAGLSIWAELNRREAVLQRNQKQQAFDRVSRLSNEMVAGWVENLQNQAGIPQALVVDMLQKAEAIVTGLGAEGAADPRIERALGSALAQLSSKYVERNELAAADDAAQRSVAIFRDLAKAETDPATRSDLVAALDRLGDVRLESGNREGAAAAFAESLALARELSGALPGDAAARQMLAVALEKSGDLALETDATEALARYRESLAVREAIAAIEATPQARGEIAVSLDRIASVLLASGDAEGAIASFERSLGIAKANLESEPSNTAFRRDVAAAHQRLGDAWQRQGDAGRAREHFSADLDIMTGLVASDPSNRGWKLDSLKSFIRVGDAHREEGSADDALAAYRAGLDMAKAITVEAPEAADWRAVSGFYQAIAKTLSAAGRGPAALATAEEAAAFFAPVAPGHPDQASQALSNLAWYAVLAGEHAKALRAIDQALAIDPQSLDLRVNKMHALTQAGAASEAALLFRDSAVLDGDGRLADMLRADHEAFAERGLGALAAAEEAWLAQR